MAQKLTEEQWLKELEHLAARTFSLDGGMTVGELAAASGRSILSVRRLLNVAKAEGRLKLGWREQEGLDGRRSRVPIYTVTPAPRKPSGATAARRGAGSSRD